MTMSHFSDHKLYNYNHVCGIITRVISFIFDLCHLGNNSGDLYALLLTVNISCYNNSYCIGVMTL